jgi:hypothetical protein
LQIPNEVPEGATATATAIPGGVGGGGGDRMSQQWRNVIYAKVSNIQTNVTAMQNLNIAKFATLERRLSLNENMLCTKFAPLRTFYTTFVLSMYYLGWVEEAEVEYSFRRMLCCSNSLSL